MEPGDLDKEYFRMCKNILKNGRIKDDRTGTGTISVFDENITVNLSDMSLPVLTTKKVSLKSMLHELMWFLSGSDTAEYLIDNDITIWHGDLYKKYFKYIESIKDQPLIEVSDFYKAIVNEDLTPFTKEQFKINLKNKNSLLRANFAKTGPIYGFQWRRFGEYQSNKGIDQIKDLINLLNTDPNSRRLMVSAWNPLMQKDMLLPPCHTGFQCNTFLLTLEERQRFATIKGFNGTNATTEVLDLFKIPIRALDLKFTMRSVDTCLGNPIDLASYGTLLHILAHITNMMPNNLIATYGDSHIYRNHIEPLQEQLERDPCLYKYPTIEINKDLKSIDNIKFEDIKICNYESYPAIKFELSN